MYGGKGEIRTHERLAPLPVFKTGAFNHSATLPWLVELSAPLGILCANLAMLTSLFWYHKQSHKTSLLQI